MKKERLNKVAIIFFAILSIIFYVIGIICFIKDNQSLAISCLCLGSSYLCLSSVFININNVKSNK